MTRPAPYPDIHLHAGDIPISWRITLQQNGEPVDLTASTVSAPVTDDGVEVTALVVEKTDAEAGEVTLTITQEVYDAVRRYSTWRFREDTAFGLPLIEGRIVKRV